MRSSPVKQRLIDEGRLLADGTNPFVQSVEHGQQGHGELLIRYNWKDPEARKAQIELGIFANQTAIEGYYGVPGHVCGDMQHDQFGPNTTRYHTWLRRIKKTFDPIAAQSVMFVLG
jgi:hypothetical protein